MFSFQNISSCLLYQAYSLVFVDCSSYLIIRKTIDNTASCLHREQAQVQISENAQHVSSIEASHHFYYESKHYGITSPFNNITHTSEAHLSHLSGQENHDAKPETKCGIISNPGPFKQRTPAPRTRTGAGYPAFRPRRDRRLHPRQDSGRRQQSP